MTPTLPRLAALGLVLAVLLGASGCSLPHFGRNEPKAAGVAPRPAPEKLYPSQFTRDGTFQSHINIDGVDFVYTLWPTKSTPRTNEWYARGPKYFSFTLTAYDLRRPLRAPFATKRMVYLSHISVGSRTARPHGRTESPYRLDADAPRITFDPQPVTTEHGMLITSPKGAFELRNQRIAPVSPGTRGMMFTFRARVAVETAAGASSYVDRTIVQRVPITIFPGKSRTAVTPIPVDAN